MKSFRVFTAAAALVLLYGCARTELPRPADLPSFSSLPFVHKIDIQQGNVITQEMVAQLKLGMDKKKVNFIMGSPIILDSFHSDRWDYLYTRQRDGGRLVRRQVTIYFADDKLARIEGDIKPAAGKLVVDTRQDTTVDVPGVHKESLIAKVKDAIPFVGDATEEVKPELPKKRPSASVADIDPATEATMVEPSLTPIERAALETQGGPGVMAKLKAAMPFTGDDASTATVSNAPGITDGIKKTADSVEESPDLATATPPAAGMLSKLKGVLPFSKTDETANADATADNETTDVSSSDEAPQSSDVDDDSAASNAWDDESYADAPPRAPTGIPLDSALDIEEAPADAQSVTDRTSTDEDEEVVVPEQRRAKERSFFDRLLGRNKSESVEASPDNRERRRYRDLSEPED